MEALAKKLFNALDDTVLAQYYDYKERGGEYPSEMSIDALISALSYHGFSPSKALDKMFNELSEDIIKEST